MARESKKLSARSATTISKAGLHSDGDGLYLVVDPSGARRWSFIYRWGGRRREMGLGNLASVSLAEARNRAAEARRQMSQDLDPMKEREKARAAVRAAGTTFGDFADKLVDDLAKGFRNDKHIAQWRMTLKVYAAPLSNRRLEEIDTEAVLAVLKPIWHTKPETASRVRSRIERVIDAATAARLRTGDNPARWRGHLATLLSARQKLSRGHHAALPYVQIPSTILQLRELGGVGSLALEFLILTACRTGEVIGAVASEFDLEAKVWTVPPERMKAGRPHRVPLGERALEIAKQQLEARTSEHLFSGRDGKRPISNMTMAKALSTVGGTEFTVHGFRSGFRDWVGDETSFPESIAEAALAHVVGDETERAYRRADALAKRRKLMDAWERYCLATPKSNVIPLSNSRQRTT